MTVRVHWTPPRQDLSRIDGIEGEAVCHLFPEFEDFSYCNVPRQEQESHGRTPDQVDVCECGLKRCPTCRERC